jgi:hypothetical protein
MKCPLRPMAVNMGITFLPRMNYGRRRKVCPSQGEDLIASTARSLLSKMMKVSVSGVLLVAMGTD